MPHSLRARLSGLRYKKIISDKDYDRLCKALDNEKILDKIRAEIEENAYPIVHGVNNHEKGMTLYGILQVIDKYRKGTEMEIHCNCTDEEIAKSFIEDVEAVKDLLPNAESEE